MHIMSEIYDCNQKIQENSNKILLHTLCSGGICIQILPRVHSPKVCIALASLTEVFTRMSESSFTRANYPI